ncbi:SseB family protein [Frondihabitans sp. PAMC 28766]|uniref:SseB family protein n=1 Tax=Frondihabitans sp. PAMC 28766 TaxID=1795630 RepID=UPI0009E66979|nr:SseB family protein [Frondihabitans sp. PAMC 28766]
MTSAEETEAREPTPLEAAILKGQSGEADMNEVIAQFVNSLVVVPTATEVGDDMNELQPVLFDREGTPMLAIFTHIDRIPEQVADVAKFAVQLPAAEFVQAIPTETGVVVNPGNSEGFEMLPEGVQQLANDVRGMLAAMEAAQIAGDQPDSDDAPPASTKVDPSAIPHF